jgi:hypothetical protein
MGSRATPSRGSAAAQRTNCGRPAFRALLPRTQPSMKVITKVPRVLKIRSSGTTFDVTAVPQTGFIDATR